MFEILRDITKVSSMMLYILYIYYPLVVFENVLHIQSTTKLLSFSHLLSHLTVLCVWSCPCFIRLLDIRISFCINCSFIAFAHFSSGLSVFSLNFHSLLYVKKFYFFSVIYVAIFFLFCYFLLNFLMAFLMYIRLRCFCSWIYYSFLLWTLSTHFTLFS